jgi:hypothetical protein
MGLLFLSDECRNLVVVVEEVTERVVNLSLGESQGLGDVEYGFAALMKRNHVPDRNAQTVDHRLAATDAFEPDNVRVLRLHGFVHVNSSEEKDPSGLST